MLTPVFSCDQDDAFVIVKIILSAICKVLEASFDINGTQFTFHCAPYYLRLKFNEELTEGQGEKASYDLDSNTLTVLLPKAQKGQPFTQLDNPGFLIATDLQRKQLISVIGESSPAAGGDNEEQGGDGEREEEEEVEFVQTLAAGTRGGADGGDATLADSTPAVHYGFANHFTGLFARLDEDVVKEMVDVPSPEVTTAEQRRVMRVQAENADFDEESVLVSFEDADGEVADLMRYVPAHIQDFQHALQGDGIVYASLPQNLEHGNRRAEAEGLEEDEVTLGTGLSGEVPIWGGNVGEFRRPLIEEVNEPSGAESAAAATTASTDVGSAGAAAPTTGPSEAGADTSGVPAPVTRLAIPKTRPRLVFTTEENDALLRCKVPRLFFPPSADSVAALTVDLLLAEAYDDLVTEGQGCSESLWNMVTLSPALSFLDGADSVYDACVAFARRALTYPLHRHFGLVQRAYAVVGTRLLLGRLYVVRALLRMRRVLIHAEHKHLLATLYVDPLVAYWMNVADADDRLVRIALEMHEDVTRREPVQVRVAPAAAQGGHGIGSSASPFLLSAAEASTTREPIGIMTLGLPLEG